MIRSKGGRPASVDPQSDGAASLLSYLERSGLSQAAFAKSIQVSPTRLNLLLRGRRCPTLNEAFSIQRSTNGHVAAEAWLNQLKSSTRGPRAIA